MVDLDAMLRGLADEPLAPPSPLRELERRASLHRRRHRRLRALITTAMVAVVALPALAVLRGEGGGGDLRVATDGTATTAPTVASPNGGLASPTTADGHVPADGRLRQPYVSPSYQPGSGALGSFRVDPAPDAVRPRMGEAQVLAAFDASDAAPRPPGSDHVTIVRFGLFSGNVSNPPGPDGKLTGTHPLHEERAWLVVFDGIELRDGGGPAIPVDGPTVPTRTGYAVAIIGDDEGELLGGLMMTAGSSGVT